MSRGTHATLNGEWFYNTNGMVEQEYLCNVSMFMFFRRGDCYIPKRDDFVDKDLSCESPQS